MRVLNVNAFLDFKTGGGTAERTFQMSRHLALAGIDCTVLTIDTGLDAARKNDVLPAKLIALPLLWRRFFVPELIPGVISRAVADADIIHLMGHWSLLNAFVYLSARKLGKPYVICPAGALPLFGRSRWLKRIFNWAIGKKIVRNASGWIAVTPLEFSHFEMYGIPQSRITVIPNGINRSDFPEADIGEFRHKLGLSAMPVILFMGRLNPIKGPDLLLEAFARVADKLPDFQLVFAGPDEGMQSALMASASRQGIAGRVHFTGFVEGQDKSAAYRMASLLVVSSRQEAMSIVALEAGICGVPVMVTDQCGFGQIKAISPLLEVPANVGAIAEGLVRLLSDSALLNDIAVRFEAFVSSEFLWSSLVSQYIEFYEQILKRNTTR